MLFLLFLNIYNFIISTVEKMHNRKRNIKVHFSLLILVDKNKNVMYNISMFNSERFDFKILSVLKLTFPISSRYSPKRSYHALIFRTHGKAEVVKGEDRIRLSKNDITFVPEGYDYNINTLSEEEVFVIHFKATFENAPTITNMHSTRPEAFALLFDKLLTAWQTRPSGFIYRMDSLFLSILEQIECQNIEMHSDSIEFRIQNSVSLIHENIANSSFSIEGLAAEAGYCVSYFRRVFHAEMGVSPKEYLISLRIRHAVALLESGYYSVEKVAELSGFDSSKYFATVFKRSTGRTPSSYFSRKK